MSEDMSNFVTLMFVFVDEIAVNSEIHKNGKSLFQMIYRCEKQ